MLRRKLVEGQEGFSILPHTHLSTLVIPNIRLLRQKLGDFVLYRLSQELTGSLPKTSVKGSSVDSPGFFCSALVRLFMAYPPCV